ncbi:MASE1 protein [Luteibacter sp. OK325]|uniref:MASE1 domain-containing protein n=1 Tax=Luteibacter sp. OK325 TaxID=2135670 RepID=UPI000D46BF7B|nr:MASE1 domain-containing protein [Luteibacter sp. OK325]PTR34276.1 MASE1 protein [Luteibacter sp. OK325]
MEGTSNDRVAWTQMVAAAASYAACYELTRHFSFSHWILPTGLRLACALLVPRRFWPALIIGETLPVLENAALCIPRFGIVWGLLASTPLIAPCMLLVAWIRRYAGIYRDSGEINMPMILFATAGAAVITAVFTEAALLAALASAPGRWPEIDPVAYFFAYLLGAYLGALTLTPTILALRERFARNEHVSWSIVWASPLARELVFAALPVLLVLTLGALSSDGHMQQGLRLAMAIPVVVITARHGWRGAAVAGMFASIAMASTSSTLMDPKMIQTQVVLALIVSTSLMAGVYVARRSTARDGVRVMNADADAL